MACREFFVSFSVGFLLSQIDLTPVSYIALHASAIPSFLPTVNVRNGTYSGVHRASFDQDVFLGIPYSYPPIDTYRYLPAGLLKTTWEGLRNGSSSIYRHTCPSANSKDLALLYGMSENCPCINFVRPSMYNLNERLPILFWIHGGSDQTRAPSFPNCNLTDIVEQSVELASPIIAVSVIYRKGPLDLMYGDEVKKEGVEKVAIKDILLALRWLKEILSAFDGDVEKETIQGQSSGPFMVGQLIVADAGKREWESQRLFKEVAVRAL